jgi:hypothetical protein
MTFESFFWGYSSHTFIQNVNTILGQLQGLCKTDKDLLNDMMRHFLLQKNDYHALGMSIQEICHIILPDIIKEEHGIPFEKAVYDATHKMHLMSVRDFKLCTGISVPQDGAREMKPEENLSLVDTFDTTMYRCIYNFLDGAATFTEDCYPTSGGSGRTGRISKKRIASKASGAKRQKVRKEFVLGRERTVFTREGEGRTLYITFYKKDVPLRAAKKLEKRVEKLRRQNKL